MQILDEKTIDSLKEPLSQLKNAVTMVFFKSEKCETCSDVEQLLQELTALCPKLKLETYDIEKHKAKAKEYEIEMVPATVIVGSEKRFVRFFGMPSGYEFSTLIADLRDVSRGAPSSMPPEIVEQIKKIDFEVQLKVFVTPTCPYCPSAVKLAHDFALLNPKIKGDMIESIEFREISQKYNVSGVPKTIINEKTVLDGAYPMDIVLKRIMELKK